MLKVLLKASLLLLLVGISAHADIGPIESAWSKQTFGAAIDFTQPWNQIEDIAGIPENCRSFTHPMLSKMADYARMSGDKQNGKKAKKIIDPVIAQLQGLRPGDACADSYRYAYLIGSYFISLPQLPELYLFSSKSPRYLWPGFEHGDNGWGPLADLLLSGYLIQKGQVTTLIPEVRKSLGEGWESPSLYGAYDCLTSRIYIDTNQRPFDLGAAFYHEISHFLRDKRVQVADLNQFFLQLGTIDWKAYLTFDELSATLEASYLQRNKSYSSGGSYVIRTSRSGASTNLQQWPYEANDDFSLRNFRGPLEDLYQSNASSILGAWQVQGGSSIFQSSTFARVVDILSSVYFPGSSLSEAQFAEIEGQVPTTRFFSNFRGFDQSDDSQFPGLTEELYNTDPLGPIDQLRYFRYLAKQSSLVSPACSAYQEGSHHLESENYLGEKLRLSDNDVARPGEHGARPGEHGARPGEHGVRPCVDLHDQL